MRRKIKKEEGRIKKTDLDPSRAEAQKHRGRILADLFDVV
jgi:hypothetical protein